MLRKIEFKTDMIILDKIIYTKINQSVLLLHILQAINTLSSTASRPFKWEADGIEERAKLKNHTLASYRDWSLTE